MNPITPDRSGMIYHLKSYERLAPFMDVTKFGTLMLLLREKDLPLASSRLKAGMDLVDAFAAGVSPDNSQLLQIKSLHRGNHSIELSHTYQYWAQPATLREFLYQQYHLKIPRLNNSKKENGLLTCIELDGNHECYLPHRYVVRSFRLSHCPEHRCPEATPVSPATGFVFTAEHKKASACPYCIAERLSINL